MAEFPTGTHPTIARVGNIVLFGLEMNLFDAAQRSVCQAAFMALLRQMQVASDAGPQSGRVAAARSGPTSAAISAGREGRTSASLVHGATPRAFNPTPSR